MSNIDTVRDSLDAYQRQDICTEHIMVRDGQLVETQVFFGGRV